ncbi:MAG: polymer-forming cytoskeletal protein [Zoogloeaceae bacterium]|jgi:cytoskeletal protein CcmA (bactofilin family)|nr:polymer-forming cytoskeletal protein [Zoogloeaceae bacterium]
MFAKKNTKGAATQIDSLIGKGTKIEGNIFFSGGLRVDGEICGKVIAESAPSTLMLSEHGVINGHVEVTYLVVNGSINGPVRAAEFLELQSKARVAGDVEYGMIEIQQGAVIEGRLLNQKADNLKTSEDGARKLEVVKGQKPEDKEPLAQLALE